MRFRKKVSQEIRDALTEQLKQYKQEMKMSKEERRELEKWVAGGRSPYENDDYIYSDYGIPMDFVSAMRFVQELRSDLPEGDFESMVCCEYDAVADGVVRYRQQDVSELKSDEELPFR